MRIKLYIEFEVNQIFLHRRSISLNLKGGALTPTFPFLTNEPPNLIKEILYQKEPKKNK